MRHAGLRARTVELKIRSSDFRTRHRAQTLREPSNLTSAFSEAGQAIFGRSLTADLLPVRLLGVGASRLTREMARQGNFFDGEASQRQTAFFVADLAARCAPAFDRSLARLGELGRAPAGRKPSHRADGHPEGQFAGSVPLGQP